MGSSFTKTQGEQDTQPEILNLKCQGPILNQYDVELKVATLNYSDILTSPYEFFSSSDSQLKDLKDLKDLSATMQGLMEQQNIKKFEIGRFDIDWQKRYSPIYLEDCGFKEQFYMMSQQQFEAEWEQWREKDQKVVDECYLKYVQKQKKKQNNDIKSKEDQLSQLKLFDTLVYKAMLKHYYKKQFEEAKNKQKQQNNQNKQKNQKKKKQFKLDSKIYRQNRKKMFDQLFLKEDYKIKSTIQAIKNKQLDILFLTEANKSISDAIEWQLKDYFICKADSEDAKNSCKSMIIINGKKFKYIKSLAYENSKFLKRINRITDTEEGQKKKMLEQRKEFLQKVEKKLKEQDKKDESIPASLIEKIKFITDQEDRKKMDETSFEYELKQNKKQLKKLTETSENSNESPNINLKAQRLRERNKLLNQCIWFTDIQKIKNQLKKLPSEEQKYREKIKQIALKNLKDLNINSNTVVQHFYNLILICPHVKQSKPEQTKENQQQLAQLNKSLSFLTYLFPHSKIIAGGVLNNNNYKFQPCSLAKVFLDEKKLLPSPIQKKQTQQDEYEEKLRGYLELPNKNEQSTPTPSFIIFPKTESEFTTYKKRTYLQPQIQKATQQSKNRMDYLITNIKTDGIQGKVMQIRREKVNSQTYLPTLQHPYDHYLVEMKVKIPILTYQNLFAEMS